MAVETVLIVDDEEYIRNELASILALEGRCILEAGDGVEALEVLGANEVNLVLTDIRMPNMDGFELIRQAHERWPSLPIITVTAFASTSTAVEALRAGAHDYITKPFAIEEVRNIVSHALQAQRLFKEVSYLKGRLGERYSLDNIIGQCDAMQRVFDTVGRVAKAPCNVLITGESGTGKDLVAQAIHENSDRKDCKFVPIDCGSIPEGLLESELFGHAKGAFTGAAFEKQGLVQTANGGTLFLDEIGDMPLSLQVKLLRLIQNRHVQKVGGTEREEVDVRVVAATNVDLWEKVAQKEFRQDLYYRINVVEMQLPALRNRGSDVSLLISHFLKHYTKLLGKDISKITPEVLDAFQRYPWPGNVRELANAVERAVTLCNGNSIELVDIPSAISEWNATNSGTDGSLQEQMNFFERQCLMSTLETYGNDFNAAAESLGISLATLYRKLKKFNFSGGSRIVDIPSGTAATGRSALERISRQ